MKATITRRYISERKAYGRFAIHKPVLASFIGTINETGAGFLNDPTGSRRFAAINIQHINHNYSQTVDVHLIWAQAVHKYKQAVERGEELWRLDAAESERREELNREYESVSMVEDLLNQHVVFNPDDQETLTSIAEIVSHLEFHGLKMPQKVASMEAAEMLKRWGVDRKIRTRDGIRARYWIGVTPKDDGSWQTPQK